MAYLGALKAAGITPGDNQAEVNLARLICISIQQKVPQNQLVAMANAIAGTDAQAAGKQVTDAQLDALGPGLRQLREIDVLPMSPRRRWRGTIAFGLAFVATVVVVLIGIWYWAAGSYHPPVSVAADRDAPDLAARVVSGCAGVGGAGNVGIQRRRRPPPSAREPESLIGFRDSPVTAEFSESRADVYTVPYVAQFSNPLAFPPDGQASYNVSRTQGEQRATEELATVSRNCPLTNYVLMGFSQGAVIVGDVAARIGTARVRSPRTSCWV